MSKEDDGFQFSRWPEYPRDVESFDPRDCEFPPMFTFEGYEKYTTHPLPPGYGYFMHLGPKTKNGEWTELALRNPIAFFVLGVGLIAPIIGITYCILLRKGYCGSPYSCERPFQRDWRFFLNILIFFSIIGSLPGLFSAYIGIMRLMAVSLHIEGLPRLDEMVTNSITQIDHLFTVNKDEIDTLTKAIVSATIATCIDDIKASDPLQYKSGMEKIRKPFEILKGYVDYRVATDDKAHAVVNFGRDFHRAWTRRYADHLTNITTYDHKMSLINFGDLPANYFCPRMLFEYDDAITEIEKLIQPYEKRVTTINDAFEASVKEAFKIIQEFEEDVSVSVGIYYEELVTYANELIRTLKSIMEKSEKQSSSYDATEISVPNNVSDFSMVVCVIFSSLYISYVVGLVVGILGSRGPRDTFGFNKKTASKILTVVLITSFAVYCICAFGSIRMFYYALVIENGVCNIEAIAPDGTGGVTIFHSCKEQDTIYTRMVDYEIVSPVPIKTNIIKLDSDKMHRKWNDVVKQMLDVVKSLSKIEEKLIPQAEICHNMWPGEKLDKFSDDNYNFISKILHKDTLYWYIDNKTDEIYMNMANCVETVIVGLRDKMKTNPFISDWYTVYRNYSSHYPKGIAKTFKEQFKADSGDINKYFQSRFLYNVSELVNEKLIHGLKKYHLWLNNALATEIGQCGVVGEAIRKKVKQTCDCIIGPLNGTWTGLFWMLLALPLTMAATIALINNYKKVAVDYTPAA